MNLTGFEACTCESVAGSLHMHLCVNVCMIYMTYFSPFSQTLQDYNFYIHITMSRRLFFHVRKCQRKVFKYHCQKKYKLLLFLLQITLEKKRINELECSQLLDTGVITKRE